jgi:hypothetical protein
MVRQNTKLKSKIKTALAYEGVKLPEKLGLFMRNGAECMRALDNEVHRLLPPANEAIERGDLGFSKGSGPLPGTIQKFSCWNPYP